MNLLLLLLGVHAWAGGAVEIMTRVFVAVSLFSLEMQLATWSGAATLRSLALFNVVLAAALFFVFHQYALVKNDLFGAVPALLVLAWIVARLRGASVAEVAWAAWLAGIALGMKLTSFPLALVLAGVVLVERRDLRVFGAAAGGAAVGLVAGGLLFTRVENSRTYGSIPVIALSAAQIDRSAALYLTRA